MKNDRPERGFLHRHPGQESSKEIQDNHVIVDIEDWEKARKYPEMFKALKEVYKDLTYKVKYQDGLTLQESKYNVVIGIILNELES